MKTKSYKIAVYPGDGIGPEVIDQAIRVLRAAEEKDGTFQLEMESFPWGYEYYRQTGTVVPDNYLDVLKAFDAILLGAVGWPEKLSDHETLAPLVRIRQVFDQYACVRPARLYPGLRSVLTDKTSEHIDLVVIRENSEGEYVNNGGRFRRGTPGEVAVQTAIHTRHGIERILRFGFDLARTRRNHLTMITKSNAQRYGFVLWDEILDEIKGEYPDVETTRQHCDAAVMNFVRCPEAFDVVVASNLFGDLLTDLGGTISGGLGLAPSSNLDPSRKYPSMFESVHGSAPDIAGQGIANPIAAVLSAAMMLDHLECGPAAESIRQAVSQILQSGEGTPDLGGSLTTGEMGDRLVAAVTDS